jgi:hypothetical protein
VLVEDPVDGLRPEEALAPQDVGRKRLARERHEVAAQPCGGRNREAALLAVHDALRQQRRGGLPQQPLLRQAAHLVARRQREREAAHDRVEERYARLERVRHRRAVRLHQQVVDEVRADVDVLEPHE